jgi:uncharacterized BrkB/YihY/UPF0761 family membrane protein
MFKSMSLGGLSWKDLAKRVYAETTDDDVLGRAAQLSYYFLLALFPALLFLTSLLGYFAGEDSQLRSSLFSYLSAVLPGDASKLIAETVNDVTNSSGGGKLSFGILATLWAASNGMGAISESLNAAYDLKETRSWWKVRLIAVGLTLALSFLIVSSLVLVLYGHDLADTVAVKFGLGAVIILMLWFYFTGVAILVGGEMNSEIENAMAKQGAPDAKEKGEKAPGAKKDSGAKSKDSSGRAANAASARNASSTPARTNAHAARGRVTRMDDHGEGFSLGKLAIVAGAWALSKVGLGRTEKRTR